MSIVSDLLTRFGVDDTETLTDDEEKFLLSMDELEEKSQLSLDDIKNHIDVMLHSVCEELCKVDLSDKQDKYLKARLKNYLTMEQLFSNIDRNKDVLERYKKVHKISDKEN